MLGRPCTAAFGPLSGSGDFSITKRTPYAHQRSSASNTPHLTDKRWRISAAAMATQHGKSSRTRSHLMT